MCRLCERASRYRNDNKYFGYSAARHLRYWGFRFMMTHPVQQKKGRYKYKLLKGSVSPGRKAYGGWPRKGNGVAQWN